MPIEENTLINVKLKYAEGIVKSLIRHGEEVCDWSEDTGTYIHFDKVNRVMSTITRRDIPKNDEEFIQRIKTLYNSLDVRHDDKKSEDRGVPVYNIRFENSTYNELLSLQRYVSLNIETLARLKPFDENVSPENHLEYNDVKVAIEGDFIFKIKQELVYKPDYIFNGNINRRLKKHFAECINTLNFIRGCKVEKAYLLQLTKQLYMLIPDTIFINDSQQIQPYQITTRLSSKHNYTGENGFHINGKRLNSGLSIVNPCLGGFSNTIRELGKSNKDLINKVLFKQHRASITVNDGGDGLKPQSFHKIFSKEEVERLFPDLEIVPAKYNGVYFQNNKPLTNSMYRYFENQNNYTYSSCLRDLAENDNLSEAELLRNMNKNMDMMKEISWSSVFMNIFSYIENLLGISTHEFLSESYRNYLDSKREETVEEETVEEETVEEETVEEETVEEETVEEETVEEETVEEETVEEETV